MCLESPPASIVLGQVHVHVHVRKGEVWMARQECKCELEARAWYSSMSVMVRGKKITATSVRELGRVRV